MYNYVYDSTRKTPLSMYYASVCAPFSNNDARVVSVEPAAARSFYVANRRNIVCASIFIWIYTKASQPTFRFVLYGNQSNEVVNKIHGPLKELQDYSHSLLRWLFPFGLPEFLFLAPQFSRLDERPASSSSYRTHFLHDPGPGKRNPTVLRW
jgi:hypothetical protein